MRSKHRNSSRVKQNTELVVEKSTGEPETIVNSLFGNEKQYQYHKQFEINTYQTQSAKTMYGHSTEMMLQQNLEWMPTRVS